MPCDQPVTQQAFIATPANRGACHERHPSPQTILTEKRTSLGPLLVGDEVVQVEPQLMQITDWYCPAEAFVLRTEVKQDGKVQRIDVTALERDTQAP